MVQTEYSTRSPRRDEVFKEIFLELSGMGAKTGLVAAYMRTPEGELSPYHLEANDIMFRGMRIDLQASPVDPKKPAESDLKVRMLVSGEGAEEHLGTVLNKYEFKQTTTRP